MSDISEFFTFAEQVRPKIDAALAGYANYADGCPTRLGEAIRHSLLAPGKRLRPLLVLIAGEACGYDFTPAMPAACAVEMVHAYSLIHDDLPAMDDDDLRRGRPSCHAAFDEATAILAGDALLAQAFEILATEITPPAAAAACCAVLAQAAGPSALVGGQADDLAAENCNSDTPTTEHTLEHLEQIHLRKTGALMRASLKLGALAVGGSASQISALDAYGKNLGLAFQVTDDLLDCQSDAATLGKATQKDSAAGKLTYPSLLGIEGSQEKANELVKDACHALTPFGDAASRLEALAQYVLERKH